MQCHYTLHLLTNYLFLIIMNIFVFGLSYRIRKDNLAALFEPYGTVQNARIILDKETHRSKGYGFVEMEEAQALEAIKALDGTEQFGRIIHCAVGTDRPAKAVSEPSPVNMPEETEGNSGPDFF